MKRNGFGMRSAGFTLVEVMIAVLISALLVGALARLMLRYVQGTTDSFRRTAASLYAQDKMEQLLQTPAATVAGGTDSSGPLSRTWTVGGESNHLLPLTVNVTFTGPATRVNTVKYQGYAVVPFASSVPPFLNFPTNFW